MEILAIVRSLNLPDCYVAAGFVRNLVWDNIHATKTALNDIDVVFYDTSDTENQIAKNLTIQLNQMHPSFLWKVKNQAFMHRKNGDAPYKQQIPTF